MRAWMRILEVRLRSQIRGENGYNELRFGEKGGNDLNITVNGEKHMSCLKDKCTITISNLSYVQMVEIIDGKFYDVEVLCGYKDGNKTQIFKGGIVYLSNKLNDTKTNTVIIHCASHLIASYSQKRLNLSLTSGINMYTAINAVCKLAGIKNAAVSKSLKESLFTYSEKVNGTVASWIEALTNSNNTLIVNTDEAAQSQLSIYDAAKENKRVVHLDSNNIELSGGFPRLTSEGLDLTILPTLSLACGDVIRIDNSLIDISVANSSQTSKNYGYYLDKNGMYMILEIAYSLTNRSSEFSLNLHCKARGLVSNFIS